MHFNFKSSNVVSSFIYFIILFILITTNILFFYLKIVEDVKERTDEEIVNVYFEVIKDFDKVYISSTQDPKKLYDKLSLYCENLLLYEDISKNFSTRSLIYFTELDLINPCNGKIKLIAELKGEDHLVYYGRGME